MGRGQNLKPPVEAKTANKVSTNAPTHGIGRVEEEYVAALAVEVTGAGETCHASTNNENGHRVDTANSEEQKKAGRGAKANAGLFWYYFQKNCI